MNWTDSQKKAIDFKAGSLLVSAGAGSGKTAVLTERFLSLITGENPIDADKILVLTFSKAAANELKTRIFNKLYQARTKNKNDKNINRQILLLKRAEINTVHSFCLNTLKQYVSACSLPINFAVADGFQTDQLKDQAADSAIAMLYQDEDSGFKQLSSYFSSSRSDNKVKEIIISFDNFLSMFKDKKAFKTSFFEYQNNETEFEKNPVIKNLFFVAKRAAEAAYFYASKAAELCSFSEGQEDNAVKIGDDVDNISKLLSCIEQNDWDKSRETLRSMVFANLRAGKNCDKAVNEQIKDLKKKYKTIIDETVGEKIFYEDKAVILEEFKQLSPIYQKLFYATEVFSNQYQNLKMQKNLVDFSDLEQKTIELLSNQDGGCSAIGQQVAENFEYIMVDEFQDTNEVQSRIFELVMGDKQNLFAVGDIKQSIYSFRRADPKIFLDLKDQSQPLDQNTSKSYLSLNENFRSEPSTIDVINRIFNPVFTKDLGDVDYQKTEQLIAKRQTELAVFGKPLSVVLVTEKNPEESDGIKAEAFYIAQKIKQLIESGYKINDNGTYREAHPSDFAILLRSAKGKALHYAEALKQAAIPSTSTGAEDFFESYEIELLVSFLKFLDNNQNDIACAAVMLSPLFGFSPDEIAEISITESGEDKTKPSLYRKLLQSKNEKAKKFVETITRFNIKKTGVSVVELLISILDINNAELVICLGEKFDTKSDNISSLLTLAESYSERQDATLKGFVDMIDFAKKNDKDIVSGEGGTKNGVSIMTVHKSKGLEWPVVFVANAKNQFNKTDVKGTIIFDNDVGIGAKLRYVDGEGELFPKLKKTAAFRSLELSTEQKLQSEQMRVFYVAATRAKQKIFVTAGFKTQKDRASLFHGCYTNSILYNDYTVSRQDSFLKWCLISLLYKYLPIKVDKESFPPLIEGEIFSIEQVEVDTKDISTPQQEQQTFELEFDNQEILQKINFVPKTKELSIVPQKLSVSAIAKQGKRRLQMPYFAFSSGGRSAKKGTAIHTFMQFSDYANAKKDVESELKRLVDMEYMTSEDAELVDVKKLATFFKSDLAARAFSGTALREYSFFDYIKAGSITPLSSEFLNEEIVVQGIADLIIIEPDGVVLVDYKSDNVENLSILKGRYETQLMLYTNAIEKRLLKKVKQRVIYSFHLDDYISF